MCIAVYKPAGKKLPSKKIFSNCFSNNDDGAGFMFPLNGKVHYEKGFMSFTDFKKSLKKAIKKYGVNTFTTPMVFHFRITSQGGVKPELTHPFPIANNYDEMRALTGDYEKCVVHNGIIDFASSYSHTIDYSDTMEFTREILFPLLHGNSKYYTNKALMTMLSYLLKSNRFLIMDGTGHVEMLGEWKQDNGVYYSNSTYSYKKTVYSGGFYGGYSYGANNAQPSSTTRRLSSNETRQVRGSHGAYGYYAGYDDDYDDYDDDGVSYDYQIPAGRTFISPKQREDFLKTKVLTCPDCGEEMAIGWDSENLDTVAVCPHCGKEQELDRVSDQFAFSHDLVIIDDDADGIAKKVYESCVEHAKKIEENTKKLTEAISNA